MARPHSRKSSNLVPAAQRPTLTLHLGGLAARRTPAQLLDVRVRELCAQCKRGANSSAYPSPAIAATAQGFRHPASVIARLISGVLMAGGPVEFGEELGRLIIAFNAAEAARLRRPPPPRNDHQRGMAA